MRRSLFVTVLIVVIAGLMASGLIGCGGGGKDDGGTEDGGVNGSTARVHVVIVTTGGTIEDLVNPTFGLTTTASVQPAMIQGFTQRLVADTPHGKVASFDITLRRTTSFNVHGLVGYCPIVFEDRNGDGANQWADPPETHYTWHYEDGDGAFWCSASDPRWMIGTTSGSFGSHRTLADGYTIIIYAVVPVGGWWDQSPV